jgi:flagellar biosynthetic protein FliP
MKSFLSLGYLVLSSSAAAAQTLDLNSLVPLGSATASGKIIQLLAVLTVLSVAPGLLIMATSFTRFAIALSFLRSGLGLQSAPANLVLISLALFMTFYVMTPTFSQAWESGLKPLIDNKISETEAFERISSPFRQFMIDHVRDKDIKLFQDLTKDRPLSNDQKAVPFQIWVLSP